jgi:cell division protein FtsB
MKRGTVKLALITISIVWIVVGCAAIWGKGGIHDIFLARQKAGELADELKQLEKETAELKKEIETLNTSADVYEIPAREKLFMKKPGEVVIYLPPDDNSTKKVN